MKKTATEAKVWNSTKASYALRAGEEAPGLDGYGSLTRTLLLSRGIASREEAEAFLGPDYGTLHDPFLMSGMRDAVGRILKAIDGGERIAIWSDYDADGIPGGVVLHDLLKKIGHENFENYIPHRNLEGFGLNSEGVTELSSRGVSLIITVDCGVTDVAEVAHAKSLGIDTIVTDHHLAGETLPDAVAIVNPNQPGCTYPDKRLCGAAVAWKLAQALLRTRDFGAKEGWEKWLLDMAGLATLSDMVPLIGENRVIAFYGLKVMRKTPRLGVLKLARKLGLDLRNIAEDDIAFSITPRINAASRMGVPLDAFRLLSATDETEAGRLADHLDGINDERKGVVASIVRDAKKHLEERGVDMKPVVVIGNPDWKPSLLGLVANSLVEEYRRPVFLWGREGGKVLKGSCRSEGVTNVVELMERAKHVFVDYGGHKMSGGFSVSIESAHLIEDALVSAAVVRDTSAHVELEPIDAVLSLDDVCWETYSEIERLAPFGFGNPKPSFLFERAVIDSVRSFGKGNLHLELSFRKTNGAKVNAIAFFTRPDRYGAPLESGKAVDLVAAMEKSTFRGKTELRLRIIDVMG